MPRKQGVQRRVWEYCDRCGFPHPVELLTKQKGMKLCVDHGCADNLDVEHRDKVIAETLRSGGELESESDKILQNPGEDVHF